MSKIAVLLMADTDTREATGRMANALTVVKEGEEEGDSVRLVLDGAGTKWAPELAREDHKYHRLFEDVRDKAGACIYCARAYAVKEEVEAAGVDLIDEYRGAIPACASSSPTATTHVALGRAGDNWGTEPSAP